MARFSLRHLSAREWALIVAVLLGLVLVIMRWEYISGQVVEGVMSYFR